MPCLMLICKSIERKLSEMAPLSKNQRVWICLEYARTNNASEVLRRWRRHWPNLPPPTVRTIMKTYNKLLTEGTCLNLNKGRSGPRNTVTTPANIQRVRNSLIANGRRSLRRNGLRLTRSTFLRIAKTIRFHPYVMVKRQKLRATDYRKRLTFCNRLVNTIAANPGFLDDVIFSDEAIFSLNSQVNTKNVIKYSQHGNGHPEDHYVEFTQGPGQVMVWLGLTRNGTIFGPHFVRGKLNTQEYMRIVRYNVIQREFRRNGINRQQMWWQQDGASAHTSNASMRYLRGEFPGKLMSKNGDWDWPPRSPDLTICDFFLWGHLKHTIWNVPVNQQPQTINHLKT